MAQYRKLILTKANQNYPELNYNSIGYYGMDRYYSPEPYQSYSNYDFPVRQELSNKSFEYTYTQGPSNRIIFRSYFRPISDNDNISEYNKKKYGHIQYPKDLYYISICPHCGAKNKFIKPNYERRTYQKNVNINKSQQLCPNCRSKMLANQNYRMNMSQNLYRTFSPKENQSIYLMPYGQKDSRIKKCTCKRRTINLQQNIQNNKIILTEDKDIVNQKSKNLKTETVMDSLDSNPNANIISKEKEDVVNNELNNINANVNDNKNKNAEINNNLENDEQKKNINEFSLQENLNLNEQNVDLNKNINDIGEDENDNVKEPDMNGDMNHNDVIEEKEENAHEEQNLHLEENNNLDSGENKNLDSGENKNLDLEKNIELNNDNIDKENENNIPQDLNENENQLNKINQNEGEQNELLNYYRNKDDEVNYYDNENENENVKENKLLNSNENENKGFTNDGNENEEINNEKIENNENININGDEQIDGYKIKYSEIERDDIPDNKNDQNILNNINTNEDSANKKDEQEQENIQQTQDNNINANNMEHLEHEVDENKDNNFNQNEIIENENNDLENEKNQLLNKDNLENEEKNNNEGKDVTMENEAHDAKVNLNEEENQYMNQNGDNEKEENININKNHQIEDEIYKEDNNVNANVEEDQEKLNQKMSLEENNQFNQVENDVIGDNGKKDEDNNVDNVNANANENNDNTNNDIMDKDNMNNVNFDNDNMDNDNMNNDNMNNVNLENDNIDNEIMDKDNMNNVNLDKDNMDNDNDKDNINNANLDKNNMDNDNDKDNINNANLDKDNMDNDNMDKYNMDNTNNNNDIINNDDNYKKDNSGEFEEIDIENKGMIEKKNIKNSQKSSGKIKPKIPKSGELLFNPKKSKKRNYKPLFNKYELEELNNRHRQGMAFQEGESVFKKAKEIFPSKYGIEMPYKSPVRQSNYSVNSISRKSMEKSIKRKTISEKKNKSQKYDEETPIKEFDYNSQKNGQFKIQKYEKKNYYAYKSNIKSDNPFEGLSLYNKNTKERKSLIAKKVEKEENEYNEINLLEGSIIKNKDLNEEELNQLINKISKFMYEDEEKNLEIKELYEYKIHRVSNIIKFMNDEAQKKILEELQNNAKDEYSTKLFEILKSKIDEYKEKLIKSYKIEETSKNDPYSFKLHSPTKKVFKKSLRKSNK